MQYSSGSFGDSSVASSPTQQIAISRFISRTYGWMFLGLMITAGVSWTVASSETLARALIMNRGIFMVLMIAELAVVIGLGAAQRRLSAGAALAGFLLYSALNGMTFSVIFMIYTLPSIGQVFMISAGMFGGLAVYGTVTRRSLGTIGTFCGMGLWGIILMSLVGFFMQSPALQMGIALAGVLVFSGLAAYDAQRVRALAYQYSSGGMDLAGSGEASKGSIYAALSLYLNFINLFLSLLRLLGNRRD